MFRFILLSIVLSLSACYSEIYVRDGVTDGDRFHIDPYRMLDGDPVTQSWIAYSLTKSICQLEIGGNNPARANSFGCEHSSRLSLLDEWRRQLAENPKLQDNYLDTLEEVRAAGFLDEYVVHFYSKNNWNVPAEVDLPVFQQWRQKNLRGFKPVTRVIGSWSYKSRDSLSSSKRSADPGSDTGRSSPD